MIALTIATSAPDHTQTLDPSISNSIECGRASPVVLAPTASGDCAVLGASTITDAKAGVATSTSVLRSACRRQANNCCGVSPWRRATWLTSAPSSTLSATIAAF